MQNKQRIIETKEEIREKEKKTSKSEIQIYMKQNFCETKYLSYKKLQDTQYLINVFLTYFFSFIFCSYVSTYPYFFFT